MFRSLPNTDGLYTFYVSQGSVATQLRCGGMFSNHFTTNFSQNAAVKKFWKSVNIWQRYGKNLWLTFLGHLVDVHGWCNDVASPLRWASMHTPILVFAALTGTRVTSRILEPPLSMQPKMSFWSHSDAGGEQNTYSLTVRFVGTQNYRCEQNRDVLSATVGKDVLTTFKKIIINVVYEQTNDCASFHFSYLAKLSSTFHVRYIQIINVDKIANPFV